MANLTAYLRRPFDLLYGYTSDETDSHGVYADTRSEGGLYSILKTQSGTSTYAVSAVENNRTPLEGTTLRETEMYGCADPRRCSDSQSMTTDD
jgi:hypothetical protein